MKAGRYETGGHGYCGILEGDTFRRLRGSPWESLATDGALDPSGPFLFAKLRVPARTP